MRKPDISNLGRVVIATVVLLVTASALQAQVTGTIITTENKRMAGQLRWKGVSRKYSVTTSGPGQPTIELEIALAQVARLEIPQPRQLMAAIEAVRGGNTAAAIPVLEKIVRDYTMLQWDEVAARSLADAYMKSNDAANALKACEVVIASNPEAAYKGEMAVVYWQALLKADRSAKLNSLIDEAIRKGGREASAKALLLRGDMFLDKQQPKEALKDGFLRVVILYQNVIAAQPEALYKAAKAFDTLQQGANAEKMRSILRTKFGASEWARKQ